MQLSDTILKAGASGGNIADGGGIIQTFGYNLSSDDAGGFLTNSTDRINLDPKLGPLADNGGLTFTHGLLPGSPAIDRGKSDSTTPTDQVGEPRVFDFAAIANASGGDGSDIGAFELGRPKLTIQRSGNGVVISWFSNYAGYKLDTTTNIAAPGWETATGSAVLNGTQFEQTISPISGNQYYRLKGS